MLLMSFCDHNIISNSTFSWWGAYLNQNKNKKIICPKKWFSYTDEYFNPKDIYCENWIKI